MNKKYIYIYNKIVRSPPAGEGADPEGVINLY